VSKSLDEAALLGFQNVVTNMRTASSNFHQILQRCTGKLSCSIVHSLIAVLHSSDPLHLQARKHGLGIARTPHQPFQGRTRTKEVAPCAIFLRVTTPFQHGQTAFSRENIQAIRSMRVTRQPAWRPPRNSFSYRGRHRFETDCASISSTRGVQHKTSDGTCNADISASSLGKV
jgi:hypothetical protein